MPYEKLEYYLDEGWLMTTPESVEKAEVNLPYSGKVQDSETIISQNTLPEE